jgi:hypothetical protein
MKSEWMTIFFTKLFTQPVDSKQPTCMASHLFPGSPSKQFPGVSGITHSKVISSGHSFISTGISGKDGFNVFVHLRDLKV